MQLLKRLILGRAARHDCAAVSFILAVRRIHKGYGHYTSKRRVNIPLIARLFGSYREPILPAQSNAVGYYYYEGRLGMHHLYFIKHKKETTNVE